MSNSLQSHWLKLTRLLCSWNSPGKNTGVGCHFLLQGIFPTQGSNLCLLHWQVDSLPLSHQGSLWIRYTHLVFGNLSKWGACMYTHTHTHRSEFLYDSGKWNPTEGPYSDVSGWQWQYLGWRVSWLDHSCHKMVIGPPVPGPFKTALIPISFLNLAFLGNVE